MAETAPDQNRSATGEPINNSANSTKNRWIRIGFGLERLGGLCLRAPGLALVVLAALIALGAFGVSHLKFDNDLRNLYRTDSAESRLLDELMSRFPVIENQIVLLVAGNRLTTRYGLETLRNIHLDLQFVDGVVGTVSPFSARFAPVGDQPPQALFPSDLPDGEALARLVAQARAHPLLGNKVLSADGRHALIMVYLDPAFSSATLAMEIQAAADETLRLANPAGLEVSATGGPIIRGEILAGVKRDQIVLNTLGTLVALILCFLYFRDWRSVLVTTLPGVVGVAWTLGTFGLIGHPLNAMTNVLPTLVLVIAFADALHMASHIRRRLVEGASGPDAAKSAVVNIGPACAMTSVTTSIVFLSLALSDSPTIREFGYAGAWAAVTAFLAVITLVPTLCAVLFGQGAALKPSRHDGILARIAHQAANKAASIVASYPRFVAAIGVIAIILATAGYAAVETRYSYRDFLPDGSSSSKVIDTIDAGLGGVDTVTILIRKTTASPRADAAPATVIRQVHEIVEAMDEFANVYSLVSIESWLGRKLDLSVNKSEKPEFKLPPHLVGQLGAKDGGAWLVTAYMRERDSSHTAPLLDQLDATLEPVRQASPDFRIDITGAVAMTDRSSNQLIWSLNISLVAAIAVTIGLIAVTFGSALIGALAAVPNFLPLAAAGSFLYLTGEGLQITSVVALTVAFGIAVDDTVHLLHDWQRRHRMVATRKTITETLHHVGPVLIATTIILTFGFATTAASTMPIVRTFGGICALTITVALIADLFLLPALLIVFSKQLGGAKPEPNPNDT